MVLRMGRFLSRHSIGLAALFVALGGTSYAVTKVQGGFVGHDGRLYACANKRTGAVRVVKAGARCRKKEQGLFWNQQGPQGASGRPGTAGPAGSIQGASAGGDLTGSYPNPTIGPASAPIQVQEQSSLGSTDPCAASNPPTGTFCGSSSSGWHGPPGFATWGGETVSFWHDRLGEVHLAGEANHNGTSPEHEPIFYLPVGFRPPGIRLFPITTGVFAGNEPGENARVLEIAPSGAVTALEPTTGVNEAFIGEVQFRTDY